MRNNLTTLERVKAWSDVKTANDDQLLTRLISSASRMILSYIQRPSLFQTVFSEVYDGVGGERQFLKNYPVLSVSSLIVGMQTIPAAQASGCGYLLDPWDGMPPGRAQSLTLRGHRFSQGMSNVQVTYTAGFVVQKEAQTVPDSVPYSVEVDAPYGSWAVDQGVTYATGNVLTRVNSIPVAGQYSVSGGTYSFASADAGLAVLISYSYVPADIEQACMELVAGRYSDKSHIGTISKSLGGQETVTYSQKDMADYVSTSLQPYKRTLLV